MVLIGNIFAEAQKRGERGQWPEAIALFEELLRHDPNHVGALLLLGKALKKLDRLPEAQAALDKVVQLKPALSEAQYRLAQVLQEQKKLAEAEARFRSFLKIRPRHADAMNHLGILLARRHCFDEAMDCFRQVLAIDPERASAHHNVGVALVDQARPGEAIEHFEKAIRCNGRHAEAHKGKGMALLKLGQFAAGWEEYEWRWKCRDLTPLETKQPLWDGSALDGRTILIHGEQGIGDMIQFLRYAPLVKARGGTVLLACPPGMFPLFSSCEGIDRLVDRKGILPPFDVHAPLLTLPRLFRTDLSSIPCSVPYLHPHPARVESWRQELQSLRAFKIGIVWQGNPNNPNDANRSVPLPQFEPLSRIPGVRLLSLQKGKGVEQLAQAGWVTDLSNRLDGAFAEVAAIMKNLDLVICCDTAVAHLAGALAVPVWVAIQFASDWRWLLDRPDSPWYPTMRIFRQERLGDWTGVFQRIAEALRETAAGERNGDDRVGPGAIQEQPEPAPLSAQEAAQGEHWKQLGAAQLRENKLSEAIETFRKVLSCRPDNADVHTNLGITLCRVGRRPEGEASLREAIRLCPFHAKAHNNLGILMAETGRRAEALECWREAVRLDPNYAEGHFNLGLGLAENRLTDEAMEHYGRALQIKHDYAEAYNNLGLLKSEEGRPGEAAILLEQAIRLKPDYTDALNNLGLALADLGRHEEALGYFREALRLRPDNAELHNHLGTALWGMGRNEEATACYEQALRLRPDFPEAHWHRALAWLQEGDMVRGWPEYEWRWKRRRSRPRKFKEPPWSGEPIEGKRILLWCEQGLGDSLQFIRYAPLVKARGARVIVECPAPLLELFRTCEGIDELLPEKSELPAFDVQAPLLTLPQIFGTTLKSIPAAAPYRAADPARVPAWREELDKTAAADGSLKIGIAWQGNPKHRWDRHRSFVPDYFGPLSRMNGVQLFSLQKGSAEIIQDDCRRLSFIDLGSRLNDFADTAAVMQCLDLVITCDSAPAHLAGALGLPVWVPLAAMSDWRWLVRREDSPWYPSMRLFRQKRLGDWDEVFSRLEIEVARLCARKK